MVFLTALGVLAAAPAAWAHATLVSTSPADGAIVAHAPTRVAATFDEPVGVSPDSLRVFAPNGGRVDTGGTTHGSEPQQIAVALRGGLGHGTYTVAWHVISADSHPVQGAFTFSIGAPSSTVVNPATVNLITSPLVGFVFGVVRWVAFCCFALLIGAVGFVLWCWPAGASSPLVLRLTMGAWSGLAASVLGAVLLQGVYGAGQGVSHVFWPNVLHATLYSRYGRALGVRLLLVIVALFVFTATLGNVRAEGRRASVAALATWGTLAAALAATWAAADHAGVGIQVPLSLVSDTIHLCAVAMWLGGLAMLATIVLRRPRSPGNGRAGSPANRKGRAATLEAAQAVDRFSPLALGCVGVILLTGTYQAWRGVGSWPALVDTTYGRLLLVKIAAMCVLIGLGYLARGRIAALRAPVPAVRVSIMELVTAGLPRVVTASLPRVGVGVRSGQIRPGTGQPAGRGLAVNGASANGAAANGAAANGAAATGAAANGAAANGAGANGSSLDTGHAAVTLAKLRWSVAAEATIAVAVLAVTAVLVNTPTARETFAPPASAAVAFDTGGPGGRGEVSVTMTPAVLGPNQVRLSVTGRAGRPYRPAQIEAFLVLPARHLGPLPVSLTADGPGRYASRQVTVAFAGQWLLRITIRSDAFDETTVMVPVSVH
jgi:copper transport protein